MGAVRGGAGAILAAVGLLAVALALGALFKFPGLGLPGPAFPASGEGGAAGRTVFSMDDPAGDDRGAGPLTYPTHDAFSPHQGLFDLQRFQVLHDGETVAFHLTFGAVTNPFSAPEGFYHQRVDIYIDTTPGEGSHEPFQPGPRVAFHPAHPWDIRLRIAPFGGTRIHTYKDPVGSPGQGRGLQVGVAPDGRTIQVAVPAELVGIPGPRWRYYVLVGGYDHFGPDEWREVTRDPEPWFFGGAEHPGLMPRVVDLLAPAWGLRSQARQLRSFDGATGRPAVLSPVSAARPWGAVALAVVGGGMVSLALSRWSRWRGRGTRGR